jgi:hypothetical protein
MNFYPNLSGARSDIIANFFNFIGLTEGEHDMLDQINGKTVIFLRLCQCAGMPQKG